MSNRAIADLCKVSEAFVRKHRKSCARNAPKMVRGKGGKLYPAKNPNERPVEPNHLKWFKRADEFIPMMAMNALERLSEQVSKRLAELQEPNTSDDVAETEEPTESRSAAAATESMAAITGS